MRSNHLSSRRALGIGRFMNNGWAIVLAGCGLLGCTGAPLTTDELYGTGVSVRDAAVVPDGGGAMTAGDGGTTIDAFPMEAATRVDGELDKRGTLSGMVTDACTGQVLNVPVGIAGRHQCSFQGKGSFYFSDLPTGEPLALTSAAPGYRPFFKAMVLSPDGTPPEEIKLQRLDENGEVSCDVPRPPTPVCSCVVPGCIQ